MRSLPGQYIHDIGRHVNRPRDKLQSASHALNSIPDDGGLDSVSDIMEDSSIMKEATSDVDQVIAQRVRELRTAQGLSLDALAAKSGVSRSMISVIERGE